MASVEGCNGPAAWGSPRETSPESRVCSADGGNERSEVDVAVIDISGSNSTLTSFRGSQARGPPWQPTGTNFDRDGVASFKNFRTLRQVSPMAEKDQEEENEDELLKVVRPIDIRPTTVGSCLKSFVVSH